MISVAPAILFVDLDGTLVGPAGVHERVWAPLAEARAAGARLAVCTGRPGRGIALAIASRLDGEGLHVFESGAVIARATGAIVHAETIPPDAVLRVSELAARLGATLEAYTTDGRYLAPARDRLIEDHEELLGVRAEIVPFPPREVEIVRLQLLVPHAAWPAIEAADHHALTGVDAHEGRSPKMPGVSFVSMTRAGVSKGSAIVKVLSLLGIGRERAGMAGDNTNDVPGLAAVGLRLVVADGAAEALALADHVIPGPSDGGLAEGAAVFLRHVGRSAG